MNQKPFIAILIVLASVFTLSCLFLQFEIPEGEYLRTPVTHIPTEEEPTALSHLDPAAECSDELRDLIWGAEFYSGAGEALDIEYTLAIYEVSGEAITNPDFPTAPTRLESLQQDTQRHEEIWQFITSIFPAEYRTGVTAFIVFTDGPAGLLGAVEQSENPEEWMLEVDIQDAEDFATLATTLIHEVMHILTLSTNQVTPDLYVFNHPEDEAAYTEAKAACSTYFSFEGCSEPESYINVFFERYWTGLYAEWQQIDQVTDDTSLENALHTFYMAHVDQFISSYAVTSLEEDIAESFLYFVLSPEPVGETIAEEKLLFFYNFPELVSLREQMRTSLCSTIMP